MRIELDGRSALVTGSTRGIGRAIAQALSECGARVAIVGRDVARAREVAAEIGGGAEGFGCDLSDLAQVQEMVERVENVFGAVDILVNNAGLTRDNLVVRLRDSDWDEVLDTNLRAAFGTIRAVARGMM
ncbi:MAG TPA: SDR family NAD(P)-dependent oxidoreductase, partial [Gemmatimonadaceae bacterium]|nr:SDR family NAD(P)-dependent oxidoreductase [Gemmatimonadaceae bacterium]